MGRTFDNFRKAVRKELQALNSPDIQKVRLAFEAEMSELLKDRIVSAGPDYSLGSKALEFRVQYIFNDMGFQVEPGPIGSYDAIVHPFGDLEPSKPVVIEVKSSKSTSLPREALRQLDDWVFELSGEERARKEGLGGQPTATSIATSGFAIDIYTHPTPHKGVMVFNGQIGQPFEDRSKNWIGENEKDFAQKRDFCIISLECLISWYDGYERDNSVSCSFWEAIHSAAGVLFLYQT
jgi:hypothetical protein